MNITPKGNRGFSLTEVVIALGVASFSLLAILGLLPVGFSSIQSATAQTGAMNLVTSIAADLRATPSAQNISLQYKISKTPPAAGQTLYIDEAGGASATIQSGTHPRYKALVQAVPPLAGANAIVIERVTITWPPQASAANVNGAVEVLVSLPTN